MTNLLLDVIIASAPARIINVSSQAQQTGKLDFDDLNGSQKYSEMRAYSQSKLANIVFTYELARRLEGKGVTVNCLHPGAVKTNFAKDSTGIFGLIAKIARPFEITPEKGATTSIYLASSPEVEGVTGKYFTKNKAVKSVPQSYEPALGQRLWDVSAALTKLNSN